MLGMYNKQHNISQLLSIFGTGMDYRTKGLTKKRLEVFSKRGGLCGIPAGDR